MIPDMAKEFIAGLMEIGTKVNGLMTKSTAMVYLLGRVEFGMVTGMKDNSLMEANMAMELIPGLMEVSILAIGRMERCMDKEKRYKLMVRQKRVSGMTTKLSKG